MRGRLDRIMDRWGPYALALLCAAVILISALWTRTDQIQQEQDAQALQDASQRLSDVTPSPQALALVRPAAGRVIRGWSGEKAVYFPESGVWQRHPALDFAAEAGDRVVAMAAGEAQVGENEVWIDHGGGMRSRYRGLGAVFVRTGDAVRPGDVVGEAGGWVPFEGEGHVCVMLTVQQRPVAFGWEWLTNE